MVSYEPCYTLMNEWWKQLYGESEGKDGKACSRHPLSSPQTCTPWVSTFRTADAASLRP